MRIHAIRMRNTARGGHTISYVHPLTSADIPSSTVGGIFLTMCIHGIGRHTPSPPGDPGEILISELAIIWSFCTISGLSKVFCPDFCRFSSCRALSMLADCLPQSKELPAVGVIPPLTVARQHR
jgi:hypothetical protein